MTAEDHERNANGWMLARIVLAALVQAEATGENLEECLNVEHARRLCVNALDEGTRLRAINLGEELARIQMER